MWIFNTVKYKIIISFIVSLWYKFKSQEGSHIKYDYESQILIIPKHKEIATWTLDNIFSIIWNHTNLKKSIVKKQFLIYLKKT